MRYLFIFWESFEPSGARMRTNTEVDSTLPSAKPSLPQGLLRGEPPNVPKNATIFLKKFVSKILVFLEKWMQGVSHYGTGPAEPRDRLRLRDTTPPLTTPPYAYVAYEREISCRSLSKLHTRTRKLSNKNVAHERTRPRAATLSIYINLFSRTEAC